MRSIRYLFGFMAPTVFAEFQTLKIGDLVCPWEATNTKADSVISSCPLLMAGFKGKNEHSLVHFIDSYSRHYFLKPPLAFTAFATNISGRMHGALDTNLFFMRVPKNAGVVRAAESAGLLFRTDGILDTVLMFDTLSRSKAISPAKTRSACLDSLAANPFYGHVRGKFLPENPCRFPVGEYISLPIDSGVRAPLKNSQIVLDRLFEAAKPRPGSPEGWIWCDFTNKSGTFWLFRSHSAEAAVFMDSVDMPEANSIQVQDLDGDGKGEFLLDSDHHYGDGSFRTLTVFRFDSLGRPGVRQLVVGGSSGEPGGGKTAGDWWLSPGSKPGTHRIFLVDAGVEHSGGKGRDLHFEAYHVGTAGLIERAPFPFAHVVLFGRAQQEPDARKQVQTILVKNPQAAKAGLRVLPRVVKSKLLWQPGMVAPNLKTAKVWTGWSSEARILKLSNNAK